MPCRLSTLVLRGSFEGSVLDGDGKEPASGSGTREESGGRKDGGRGESSGEEGGQQEDKAKREERGAARALGAGSGAGETSVTLDDVVGAAAETLRALVVERSTVDAADWAIRAARGLQALTRLSLAGTPVPESVLAPLDGHPSLRELVLSGDPSKTVSDRLTWSDCAATLPTISSLSCLCLADRRGLRAGGAVEGLEWMCALTGLRSLSLGGVGGVGNAAAAAIGALTGLEALDLSMAKRVSDTGLLAVSCLTRLSALRLDGCERVSDAGLRAVAPALPCLANLSVARLPRLTDDGLSSFAGAPLTRLCVADCRRVSGYGLRGLCPDGTLQIADMESCAAMSDLGLLWLSRQTALRSVNLYWCQRVSDDGVAALGALRGLTSLCLRGCVLRMLCGDQPHDFER